MHMRVWRHYVPASLAALATVEAVVFIAAVYAGAALRFAGTGVGLEPSAEALAGDSLSILPNAFVFATVMLLSLTAFGLFQSGEQDGNGAYYLRCAGSFGVGLLAMTLIFYAVPELTLGRGVFALALLIAFAGHLTTRLLFLRWIDREAFKRRILVLGTGSRAARVAELERINGYAHRFHVVGYLPLNGTSNGVDSSLILRENGASLQEIAEKYRIDEIVVGVRDRRHGDMPMSDLLERKLGGTNIIDLPTFFERETGRVQLESVNASWLIFSDGFHQGTMKALLKRLFDVALSAILLLITLPVMIATALAIWVESGRPILYRQERTGAAGRTFQLLKFRSMRVDAEADGVARWATKNDRRCTRVGKFIRKLRIDELPQLWNVLRGEMSFVGPRPERPAFVGELSERITYYSYRHSVKPGITGWAQVRYPYGASVEDAKEKLQYDLYYVKNHSLFLDLIILAQTAHIVLFGKGAH